MDQKQEEMIAELAALLRSTVNGRYALALAGSLAKGIGDAGSDIDFLFYVEEPKPYEERRRIIETAADKGEPLWISPDFKDGPWGGTMDFRYRGVPVETTVKLLPEFEQRVKESLEGQFEVLPADWTSNGYCTFICLSELSFVKPIDDPQGILRDYRRRAADYPPELRKNVIERFWNRSGPWLNSFHYASAIERGDILFTGPIVQHIILDTIQVLFALNRVYFTGDKKLEHQLGGLSYCPVELLENLEFLLSAPKNPALLLRQKEMLIKIRAGIAKQLEIAGYR